MQQIDDVIKQYLEMETNYSIMISGNWGVGKTYYYKNQIFELIKTTDIINDGSKKYKPLIISLFGIKNIEELQSQIFLSLYPFLKNEKIKIGSSIAKAIAKGILMIKGLGEYSKILDNVDVKKYKFINFNELVICFDDLERRSKSLELEEIIGFINNLVENENAKVVIIANENKIAEENYKIIKEKVVGNTIEFQPDIKKSTNNIISSKFAGFKTYMEFLNENVEIIYASFFAKSNNLRTLNYALSYFHKIYSSLEIEIQKHKILKSHKKEIFQKLFKYTLVISIENKEGFLDYKNRENLDNNQMTGLDQIRLENLIHKNKKSEIEIEESKDYKDKFLEKYYPDEKFDFFTSIYDYLTGGNIFNVVQLIDELNILYHIEENEIQEQYKIYNTLSYPKVFDLTDEEYIEKTTQLKKDADKGLYKINDYLTIFYFLSRFENPLNFDLEELTKDLKSGIDKSAEQNEKKYIYDLDFYLNVSEDSENKEYLKIIRAYILDKNNEINEQNKSKELDELEKLYYENKEDFFKTIFNNESKYIYTPIYTNFDTKKFCENFVNTNNVEKWKILRYFKMRYKNSIINEGCEELIFFEQLLSCLNSNLKENKGLSSYISNEFKKVILENCNKLKNNCR